MSAGSEPEGGEASARDRKVSSPEKAFHDKGAARSAVWDALEEEGVARFPFPPHGRIPNFAGAAQAAERLFETGLLSGAERIKVNPDAPQRHVRIEALRRGCDLYVPSPRLRDGFKRLDPTAIPEGKIKSAAALSNMDRWAEPVPPRGLPELDAIVVGSVAVTTGGRRCGKGEGFSDLEYAILRELGHGPVPVATTVHPLQVVGHLPQSQHDVPLSLIAAPSATYEVKSPPPPPSGIDWAALPKDALSEMPVLREVRS